MYYISYIFRIFVFIMNNTRFATIIHILTLLAKYPGQWLSSDWIATSIAINPVMVRRELGLLQEQGWVISRKGKEGGSMLGVDSEKISLADIFNAVKNTNVLGKKNRCSDSACSIGKDINKELAKLFEETDSIVTDALKPKTLKNFVAQFD